MLTSSSAARDSPVCPLLGTASLQILPSLRQWPVADVDQGGTTILPQCRGFLCRNANPVAAGPAKHPLSIHSLLAGQAHTRHFRELLRMDHVAANLSFKARNTY